MDSRKYRIIRLEICVGPVVVQQIIHRRAVYIFHIVLFVEIFLAVDIKDIVILPLAFYCCGIVRLLYKLFDRSPEIKNAESVIIQMIRLYINRSLSRGLILHIQHIIAEIPRRRYAAFHKRIHRCYPKDIHNKEECYAADYIHQQEYGSEHGFNCIVHFAGEEAEQRNKRRRDKQGPVSPVKKQCRKKGKHIQHIEHTGQRRASGVIHKQAYHNRYNGINHCKLDLVLIFDFIKENSIGKITKRNGICAVKYADKQYKPFVFQYLHYFFHIQELR